MKNMFLIMVGALLAATINGKCPAKEPACKCPFPNLWNKRKCVCMERPKCKTKCAEGLQLHPYKSCKCVSVDYVNKLQQSMAAKLVRCEIKNGKQPSAKFARCGGRLEKCNIYERYNWDICKCERKNYCSQGCPTGQSLHPGYSCKCVDFLDEAIPEQCLKEESASGCGDTHYYSDEAQMCVKYDCCQKFNDCGVGFRWSQSECDCVRGSTTVDPVVRPPARPEPPTPSEDDEDDEDDREPNTRPGIKPPRPDPVEVVEDCEEDFEWDSELGYCREIRGKVPQCPSGKEWSDRESDCVWKEAGCKNVPCRDSRKQGRWYNGACRCFTNKAWCRLQKCGKDRQGFAIGNDRNAECRCYSLKENCMARKCSRGKKPGFFNGRCSCYTEKGLCQKKQCPPGRSGYFTKSGQCQCMTTQEQCSQLECPSGKRGFFWDQKCKCQSSEWICSLKRCGNNKTPTLFRGSCLCLWNKGYCDRKKCPSGMEARWNKGSCRCFLNKNNCNRLKCLPQKEGKWADNWCRCFWKESNCSSKRCPRDHFAAWFKDRCRCFANQDDCSRESCPQGEVGVKDGNKCRCQRDPDWKPPAGLCDDDQVWSAEFWGCIDRETTCRKDQTWSRTKKRCVRPSCSDLTVWSADERRCVCKAGTYYDDDVNTCVEIECGAGWVFDAVEGSCIVDVNYKADCPSNMKWSVDKQRCVCTKGYYYSWKQSKCRRVNCGNMRRWSDRLGKCETPECDKGQVWRKSTGCRCRAGYYLSKTRDTCTRIPECELGDKWSSAEQECVLDPDYVGECERFSQWSRTQRKCVCISGYFFNKRSRSCEEIDCDDDEKWSKRHTRCIPRNCPQYMVWDDETVQCECVEDRFWSRRQKRCIPIYCPDGEKFNFKREECVRIEDLPNNNPDQQESEPKPEPPKPTPPSGRPVRCRAPKKRDPSTNTCVCEQLVSGKGCPKGRKLNARFCRCSIRTADCPAKKNCGNWRLKWNGAAGVCKCERTSFGDFDFGI